MGHGKVVSEHCTFPVHCYSKLFFFRQQSSSSFFFLSSWSLFKYSLGSVRKRKVLGKSVSGSVWLCIIFLHLVKLTFIEKVIFFKLKPISKFSPQRNFDKRLNSLPFCIKWRLVTLWRSFTGAEGHGQVTVILEDFLAGGSAAVNWNRMLWSLYEIHVKSVSVHLFHR